jgi:hypothetical protein
MPHELDSSQDGPGEHPGQQPLGQHLDAVAAGDPLGQQPLELLGRAFPAFQRVDRVDVPVLLIRLDHPRAHHARVVLDVHVLVVQPDLHHLPDGVGHHPAPVQDHAAVGARSVPVDCSRLGLVRHAGYVRHVFEGRRPW